MKELHVTCVSKCTHDKWKQSHPLVERMKTVAHSLLIQVLPQACECILLCCVGMSCRGDEVCRRWF